MISGLAIWEVGNGAGKSGRKEDRESRFETSLKKKKEMTHPEQRFSRRKNGPKRIQNQKKRLN